MSTLGRVRARVLFASWPQRVALDRAKQSGHFHFETTGGRREHQAASSGATVLYSMA